MCWEGLSLEKKYYIDIKEENERKILDTFGQAETTQLSVIENNMVIGILDLFSFTKTLNQKRKVIEIVEKNIIVAREEENICDFYNLEQKILPFVDENGLYIGYIKREGIQKQLQNQRHKELEEEFNAILESSYDGIHVTDGKGVSLRFNSACERIEGINRNEVVGKYLKELVDSGIYAESLTLKVLEKKVPITMLQKINGKEVIASATPIFKNGEIIRVVTNSRDISELNTLKKELQYANHIKEKYQSELELLRLEQMTSDEIIVRSPDMGKIVTLALHVALVDSTVLIQGESGVGKGVLSNLIHQNSKRKKGPFIKIDCGAIPESLLESELFGYEKGAFTGANKDGKIGLIELANDGTLFLDEIGELSLILQVKLLRVLQDREIFRVGGNKAVPVDIRIIAATNKDLEKMVKEKTFREDLYYRLNVVPIFIPPLRERKEDVYPFIINCLDKFNNKYKLQKRIQPQTLEVLIQYDWPGNVRELQNIIERMVVTTSSESIGLENLPSKIRNFNVEEHHLPQLANLVTFKEAMDSYEIKLLLSVMEKSENIQEMSKILKIDASTVRRKLKKHRIETCF